jgi:hypothetical protein
MEARSRAVVDMGVYGRILVDNMHEMYIETDDPDQFLTIYQTKTAQTLGSWVSGIRISATFTTRK